MKKLLLTMGLITLTSSTVFAQATLDEQLGVTRDAISRLTGDLQRRDSTGGLRLTEYREWEQNFKRDVEKNFERFEQNLSQKVYGPLMEVISKMNIIAKDENLQEYQKKSLLKAYDASIQTLLPTLQNQYHQILESLYNSNNHFASDLKVLKTEVINLGKNGKPAGRFRKIVTSEYIRTIQPIYSDGKGGEKSFQIKSEAPEYYWENYCYRHSYNNSADLAGPYLGAFLRNEGCNGSNRDDQKLYPFLMNEFASYEVTHERLIKGCKSKACVLVKTSDIAFWYSSISSVINKIITFETPSGTSFSLKRGTDSSSIVQKVLQRTDLPARIENLPFDY